MDWRDRERRDYLTVEMVHPTSFNHLGWLKGVTGATVTEDYESDTRIAATVTTVAPESYIDLALLRIHHECRFSNGDTWNECIGTFFALRSDDEWVSGVHQTTFDCKSMLYGMEQDIAPKVLTIKKGGKTKAAFETICKECKRPRRWVSANDKAFGSNTDFDAGQSYLERLHDLAEKSDNRVDVTTDGVVTIQKLVKPAKRSPVMKLAWNSPLVLASGISMSTDDMEVTSRAIVTWKHSYKTKVRDGVYKSNSGNHKKGDPKYKESTANKDVTAWADVPSGNRAHIDRRGFRVASWHSEDDLGDSQSVAQKKAKEYLAEEDEPNVVWTVPCRWFDIHEGQVISWLPPDATQYRNCLVESLERDLWHYTQTLTLKEV